MTLLEQIKTLDFPAPLPKTLLVVEQSFEASKLPNLAAAVKTALDESGLLQQMQAGQSVAVGVGSRGIANLPQIVRATISHLKQADLRPFVIPTMGSHGGATAEGQRDVLAQLGVTEDSVGAEIRATMDVLEIGQIPDGPPLFQDANAHQADHTLLIGRVKPHTDFRGKLESGLAKMALIGQGKRHGAELMHQYGPPGFQKFLAPAARIYEENSNLIGGLAILENAYDETAEIIGLPASDIGTEREEILLERAKSYMPSLPFDEIDVLVLKQMGKDISGTGMDTNIVSRLLVPRQPENFGTVDVALITVLSLTEATHGNVAGLGLANVTTARVAEAIDWGATYTNAITSGVTGAFRVSLPMTMPNDQQALQVSLRCCGVLYNQARFVFIKDTLSLETLWVSPTLRAAVEAHPRLSIVDEVPLRFEDGLMQSPWQLS